MSLAKKIVPFVVLGLAVLVDGFFGFANFYPNAPPKNRGPKQLVLADMTKARAKWFQENILDELNDEMDANVELQVPNEKESLLAAVERLGKDPALTAVIMPKPTADLALEKGLVKSFEGAVPRATIDKAFEELRPENMTGAQVAGKQAFLPRGASVTISLYRVSRVRDAILHWETARPAIEAALRAVNGRGLPDGYTLQENPRLWDSYDRFVLAYYWAHRSYNGFAPHPRVAHPTGDALDGQVESAAEIYRAGATDETFTHTDSPAAADAFMWESLYAKEKLFLPEMMDAAPLDDHHIVSGLQTGDLFVANVDLASAFILRGGSFYGALTYIQDPDDLGFVVLPRFSSLELDAKGQPARSAKSFAFKNELVWALPSGAKDVKRAFSLATWLAKKENHVRDCEAMGYVPMRKDVFREVTATFRNYWMSAAFDAALEQWPRAQAVPPSVSEKRLGSVYAQLWRSVVAAPGGPLPRDRVLAILTAPPAGNALPETAVHGALKPPPEAAAKEGAFVYPKIDDPIVLDLFDAGARASDAGAADGGSKKDGGK